MEKWGLGESESESLMDLIMTDEHMMSDERIMLVLSERLLMSDEDNLMMMTEKVMSEQVMVELLDLMLDVVLVAGVEQVPMMPPLMPLNRCVALLAPSSFIQILRSSFLWIFTTNTPSGESREFQKHL